MNITHWHGMTRNAFEAFRAGKGKSEAGLSPWTVSEDDGRMYFYSVEKAKREYGEHEDIENLNHILRENCYAQAEIQAAFNNESEIIVLGFNLETVDIEDDYSCPNMADIADCAYCEDVNIGHVVKAYSAKFNVWKSPFVISGLIWNDCLNTSELDEELLRISQIISKSNDYLEFDPPEFVELHFTEN